MISVNKITVEAAAWMTSEAMSIVVDVNRVSDTTNQDDNIYERIKKAAQDGDIERLQVAEKGQTHFAMELMTLKPSLALKLNASDDLTIKCETAVHIAVKNHRFEASKVLLGWVKRANREEVLDWKDEDGKTVLHIAALTNQPEVMKLLRGSVKAKAKNLDGKTAMDILQIHQSPLFSPEATSSLFNSARERLVSTTITTLAKYLSKKPSFIEKWNNAFGLTNLSKTRNASLNSNDSRSVILVVAILIVTATYQANLSPPGGFWQEDSKRGDRDDHLAGQMTMTFYVLYGSIAALRTANFAMLNITFPTSHTEHRPGEVILKVFLFTYPAITSIIVFAPFAVFFLNKWRRRRVDFPASAI
ncbi:hypothetical protein YC2023_002181 [Brassica napus]